MVTRTTPFHPSGPDNVHRSKNRPRRWRDWNLMIGIIGARSTKHLAISLILGLNIFQTMNTISVGPIRSHLIWEWKNFLPGTSALIKQGGRGDGARNVLITQFLSSVQNLKYSYHYI